MKKVYILLGLGLILAAAALVEPTYRAGWWRFNYPTLKDYPVHGLDVSHHQKEIDWPRVPKDLISFVYIKASEGGDWKDRNFQTNWAGADTAGFKVGAYHFFTLCKSGAEQAENFLATLPEAAEMLPPAIDLEFGGNCAARPESADFLRELEIMAHRVETETGQRPVLYITYDFYEAYLKNTPFAAYPLWVRNIYGKPNPKEFPSATIWQYAANARVDGISGSVDLNISLNSE